MKNAQLEELEKQWEKDEAHTGGATTHKMKKKSKRKQLKNQLKLWDTK